VHTEQQLNKNRKKMFRASNGLGKGEGWMLLRSKKYRKSCASKLRRKKLQPRSRFLMFRLNRVSARETPFDE
jgi:hypothetical protein